MKTTSAQSLTENQKQEVFELLENWLHSKNIYSKQKEKENQIIASSSISPIINTFELANVEKEQEKDKKEYALKLIKEVCKSNVSSLKKNDLKDMEHLANMIQEDKQLMELTYQQITFFLYWLRRLVK